MKRRLPDLRARQYFDRLKTPLTATARRHGYALAVHGSLARDIDLVAIPWVPNPSSPADLIAAIVATASDVMNRPAFVKHDPNADPWDFTKRCPEPKFHGRLGWSIYLADKPGESYEVYLDLSVMPAYQDAIERRHQAIEQLVAG